MSGYLPEKLLNFDRRHRCVPELFEGLNQGLAFFFTSSKHADNVLSTELSQSVPGELLGLDFACHFGYLLHLWIVIAAGFAEKTCAALLQQLLHMACPSGVVHFQCFESA